MTEVTDSRKPTKKSSKPSSVVLENENQAVQGHTDDASFHPWPGQQLLEALKTRKVDEKELHGIRVSTRALEQLTPQEIRDLKFVFDAFDLQNTGKLAVPEVGQSLKALGFRLRKDEASQLVHNASVKQKGFVTFNEFLDIVISKQGDAHDTHEEILQGFRLLDYDREGRISLENLSRACREAGCSFSQREIHDMLGEADLNGDGFVDQQEFIKIMLQTQLFDT